jgi:hypothetical protein
MAGVAGASGGGGGTTGGVSGSPGDGGGTAGGGGTGGGGGNAAGGVGSGGGGAGANDGGAGTADGAAGSTDAAGSTGAAGEISPGWRNYEVSGSLPRAAVAISQKPGTLKFTKTVIHDQFLAESCAIADYNLDGVPDVSSGRIWYEGPTFKTQHPFRDGHGPLPRTGSSIEINTGVSDDSSDHPWDMDGDGDPDIIDVAQPDMPESNDPSYFQTGTGPNAAGTPNKIGTVQVHATAYWYENPGKAGLAGDPKWTMHLMHADVRGEQHVLVDMNGDGYPEIVGACRDCPSPPSQVGDTKGYYQGDPTMPTAAWTYHPVTGFFAFPFGNVGRLHGLGAGDINGDGLPDFMDRSGAYLQQPGGTWNLTVCTGKNTPAGCGLINAGTPLLPTGFSEVGFKDTVHNVGPSQMYSVDMDQDGCSDVVAAEWAHGIGLYWYEQQRDATGCTFAFKKFQFMGNAPATANYDPSASGYQSAGANDAALWGAGFTEPHALEVYDMDGDGRPDVITGKMRFAQPIVQGDRDPYGTPYLYVFKNVAAPDARNGAPITLQPVLVDGDPNAMEGTPAAGMGVGQQIAIGHVNTDGIMDICIASKVGLAVFLGQ